MKKIVLALAIVAIAGAAHAKARPAASFTAPTSPTETKDCLLSAEVERRGALLAKASPVKDDWHLDYMGYQQVTISKTDTGSLIQTFGLASSRQVKPSIEACHLTPIPNEAN